MLQRYKRLLIATIFCTSVLFFISHLHVQEVTTVIVDDSSSYQQLKSAPLKDSASVDGDINGRQSLEAIKRGLQRIVRSPFNNDNIPFDSEAIRSFGTGKALDIALMKLLLHSQSDNRNKKKFRIAAVGGSTTASHGIRAVENYGAVFTHWLKTALYGLNVEVSYVNAGFSATSSLYFSLCIKEHLNLSDYDILLVEFAYNEDWAIDMKMNGYIPNDAHAMEQLVRVVRRENPLIEIVFVNFHWNDETFGFPQRCSSISEEYLIVAQHYHLTAIDWKHTICNKKFSEEQLRLLNYKYISEDDHNHGGWLMHFEIASFLSWHVRNSAANLKKRLGNQAISAHRLLASMVSSYQSHLDLVLSPDAGTVYTTTKVEAADCFLAINRTFVSNQKLTNSLTNRSPDFNLENKHGINKHSETIHRVGLETLQYYVLQSSSSFMEFFIDSKGPNNISFAKSLPCQGGLYQPRLEIAYRSVRDIPTTNKLSAVGLLKFTDGTLVNLTYNFTLNKYMQVHTDIVRFPLIEKHPHNGNNVCWNINQSKIESLRIRFQQLVDDVYFAMHGLVVSYECCTYYNISDDL